MSLKEKTVSGLIWSFIESFSTQGITFIVGVILARLLTPQEFGLVGMITIFIAITSSLINGGFGTALIQKKNCNEKDFSTAFYFNVLMGIFFFLILFLSASAISHFFNEPQLIRLIQVLGIVIIIDAFSIVQRSILAKRIDFKLQTKISIIASIFSGIIGLTMAFNGFGVWSLVAKQISQQAINTILLWIWNKWRPLIVFSMDSFRQLFSFGYKLLISNLIDSIFRNLYYLVIGKYFSAQELGFYTRADQFQALPSSNIQWIIGRVSFPIFSSIQDDIPRLREAYRKLIQSSMLISFVLMFGLAAVAKPMILTLIGNKWEPSIIYLQMLCFVGMFYPLHAINLNMLAVLGRSDLFLKLEIIKRILSIPVVMIGIFIGIKTMIVGMIVLSGIAYFLNSYYSGRQIGYSSLQQLKDIYPSFILAAFIGGIVYLIGLFLNLSNFLILAIQLLTGGGLFFVLAELLKIQDYIFVKEIFLEKLIK